MTREQEAKEALRRVFRIQVDGKVPDMDGEYRLQIKAIDLRVIRSWLNE